MTLDETIDLLTQIAIYAGIAAVALFAVLFIIKSVGGKKPDGTSPPHDR